MAWAPGTRIGDYEIIELLGAGGMGEVYSARDTQLQRLVAVKVIGDEFADSQAFRERFRREARALAALSHPNIAVVHSVEETGDVLMITMELVEGETLADLIRPGGLAVDRLLKIAIQTADALAAAHERGITHRDLKPANIMVSPDGRVKVLDFGLAKLSQRRAESEATTASPDVLTTAGHIVGTAAYMSPEQAEGRLVDFRGDIFSFGIVLYEMATGERPFKGSSPLSILSAIVRDVPAPPSQLNPQVPRELSRIIRRCLAKDPEERYQSARDLRNDLSDLRVDVSSGQIPLIGSARVTRFSWRIVVPVAALVLVLVVGAWLGGRWFRSAPASALPPSATQLTFFPGMELSPSLSPDGRWVVYSRRSGDRSDVYLHAVGGENAINLTKDLPGGNAQPAFSPDGERIAFRGEGQGGGLFVMGRTGELVRRVSDAGYNPAWSPDGKWLAYSTSWTMDLPSAHQGGAELWVVEVETGNKRRLDTGDAVQPTWSPNERIAYWGVDAATHQRDIWTVSPDGGTPIRLTSDAANDMSPSWSPDGRHLYFASDRGGALNLWRLATDGAGRGVGAPEPVTMPNSNAVHPAFSASGRQLAYATYTWHASVFAVPFDPQKLEVQGPPVSLVRGPPLWTGPRVSPDGAQLAIVRWGQQLDLFIGRSDGTQLRRVTSDPLGVRCPEWSPDGTRIAYMRNLQSDGSVQMLDVRTGDVRRVDTSGIGSALTCPSWSPDGKRIAIGQGPPREGAYVLTLSAGDAAASAERLPESSEGAFMPRAWSPDGQWLSGTVGSRLVIYSLSKRQYTTLTDHGTAVSASPAPWLPDGRHILFLSPALDIVAVHTGTKAVTRILSVAPERLHGFSVSRDGRQVFYGQGPEEGDIWLASWPEER